MYFYYRLFLLLQFCSLPSSRIYTPSTRILPNTLSGKLLLPFPLYKRTEIPFFQWSDTDGVLTNSSYDHHWAQNISLSEVAVKKYAIWLLLLKTAIPVLSSQCSAGKGPGPSGWWGIKPRRPGPSICPPGRIVMSTIAFASIFTKFEVSGH